MKTKPALLTGFGLFVALLLSPNPHKIILTSSNFVSKGWSKEQISRDPNSSNSQATITAATTPYVDFHCDPQNHPSFVPGCVKFILPVSTDPNLKRLRLRCKNYSGTFLRTISTQLNPENELLFSTYVIHNINESNIVLVLQVDNDNDNAVDCNIAYSPTVQYLYNNPNDTIPDFSHVLQNTWQEWDASMGWWTVGIDYSMNLPPSLQENQYFTLGDYLKYFPNARILDGNKGPSIRFTIGGDTPDHNNFIGYLDGITISQPETSGNANSRSDQSESIVYDFKKNGPCHD
jgi:hypothetical protein